MGAARKRSRRARCRNSMFGVNCGMEAIRVLLDSPLLLEYGHSQSHASQGQKTQFGWKSQVDLVSIFGIIFIMSDGCYIVNL